MKGLELCKEFYNQFGAPMLKEKFSEILPLISVGLVGSGSECLGFDDDISCDHDFEPGFCIFLPEGGTYMRIFRLKPSAHHASRFQLFHRFRACK